MRQTFTNSASRSAVGILVGSLPFSIRPIRFLLASAKPTSRSTASEGRLLEFDVAHEIVQASLDLVFAPLLVLKGAYPVTALKVIPKYSPPEILIIEHGDPVFAIDVRLARFAELVEGRKPDSFRAIPLLRDLVVKLDRMLEVVADRTRE
jgi:hypothetical protein